MEFISEELSAYINQHSEEEPSLLAELSRETWQKVLAPRMLSGHFQGRVLALLSKLVRPNSILEIGTYTGYATLCLAEGLRKDGQIHTIDRNEELGYLQQKYFNKSEYSAQIKSYTGNALTVIPQLKGTFDLVFIDADKKNYINYFNLIIDRMNPGGIILSDNVLWSGKVLEAVDSKDIDTQVLKEYNRLLKEDPRIETILLPIRDGLTVSRVRD
ncbi:O-methyltransferase [Flavobacteriaceae bacterium F08102]|nr:O-methyltransferase [Flavobacteriaceae bacterium F08102]